jgi:hypothetical protein
LIGASVLWTSGNALALVLYLLTFVDGFLKDTVILPKQFQPTLSNDLLPICEVPGKEEARRREEGGGRRKKGGRKEKERRRGRREEGGRKREEGGEEEKRRDKGKRSGKTYED